MTRRRPDRRWRRWLSTVGCIAVVAALVLLGLHGPITSRTRAEPSDARSQRSLVAHLPVAGLTPFVKASSKGQAKPGWVSLPRSARPGAVVSPDGSEVEARPATALGHAPTSGRRDRAPPT